MPLGLMPGMSFEEKEIELEKGESVLFYSDGLVEAHDPKGEMFGFPRLRRMVAEHAEELRAWVNTDSAARDIFRHIRPAISPLANVRPIRRLAMDRDP